MVDPSRLRKQSVVLADWKNYYSNFDFNWNFSFTTRGELILITDPIYLADVYNSHDWLASFVRRNSAMAQDFGGDTSCPAWWQPPYLILPVSGHYFGKGSPDNPFWASDELEVPPNTIVLSEQDVGCDSASFVFLPVTSDIPAELQAKIDEVLEERNGVLVSLPAGKWTVYHEQFDTPEGSYPSWYRDIILKWESPD